MVATAEILPLQFPTVSLVVSVPLLLVGAFLAFLGLWNGYSWVRMRSMTTTTVADADDGLVELEATVAGTPDGERYTAPYTGANCVGFDYAAEYYHAEGDEPDSWVTVEEGTELQPFLVGDDTGTALVDPEAATVSLEDRDYERTPETLEDVPAGVETVIEEGRETGAGRVGPIDVPESAPHSAEMGTYLKEYRFGETRLEEGDEVYVVGPATTDPTETPSDARVVVGGEDTSTDWAPFEVSDRGEGGAERNRAGGAVFALVVGVVLAGAGLYVTVGAL